MRYLIQCPIRKVCPVLSEGIAPSLLCSVLPESPSFCAWRLGSLSPASLGPSLRESPPGKQKQILDSELYDHLTLTLTKQGLSDVKRPAVAFSCGLSFSPCPLGEQTSPPVLSAPRTPSSSSSPGDSTSWRPQSTACWCRTGNPWAQ